MKPRKNRDSNSTDKEMVCSECSETKLSYLANAITGTVGFGLGLYFLKEGYANKDVSDIGAWVATAVLTLPVVAATYFLTQTAANVINKYPFKTPCSKCKYSPASHLRWGISIASSYSFAIIGCSAFKNNKALQETSILGAIAAGFTVIPWFLKSLGCKEEIAK